MAVAFDAVGPSSAGATSATTSLSWSHTCSGSNRLVVAACAAGLNNDSGTSTSATYAGTSMNSVTVVHSNNSTGGYIQMWYLVAPATGTSTVAITQSGGAIISLVGGSISFTGVDQTTPLGTAVTGAGTATTTWSVSVGTTSGNNMVVDATSYGSGISGSGQTNRWLNNFSNATAAGNAAQSTAAATGSSVSMSYSTASADWYGIIAVEVLAASSGLSSLLNTPSNNRARLIRASSW